MIVVALLLISVGGAVAILTLRRSRDTAAFGGVAGGIAVACAGLLGLISFTTWNPPDAIRVAIGVVGALSWAGALGAGAGQMARGDRRRGGQALLLATAAAAAVIAMAAAAE